MSPEQAAAELAGRRRSASFCEEEAWRCWHHGDRAAAARLALRAARQTAIAHLLNRKIKKGGAR
jgi:hypothetical protein